MTPRWRIVVVAVVIFGFGLVMAIHPQDASDIASMARDLKKTLKDVDERLRHLEQLVKALSTGAKKTGSHTPVSPAAVAAAAAESEAASRRFAAQEAYQKGRIEEASQQDAKAIELFTKACELDPANDSAFLHRAFVNYRTGRVDEALSDVNRSLAIQPDNSRAFAFRATVYRTMKDYGRAMADLTEAARRDDRNPEYLAAQAGIEEERGNFSKAVDLYAAAVLIDGQSTGLHLKLASALNATGDQQAALQECIRAIDLRPKEAEGYACRADSYVRSLNFQAAVSDLNQAISLRPDSPQAVKLLPVVRELLQMNQAAGRLGTPPGAPASASPASSSESSVVEAARNPASSSVASPVQQEEHNSVTLPVPIPLPSLSISAALSQPAPEPGKLSDLMKAARDYLDQGMFPLAIAKLSEAIALDPSSAVSYNSRGYAYLRSRAYVSAIGDFSKAIEIRPLYANAYWNRGVARRLQGDKQGAAEDARMAGRLGWVVNQASAKATSR